MSLARARSVEATVTAVAIPCTISAAGRTGDISVAAVVAEALREHLGPTRAQKQISRGGE